MRNKVINFTQDSKSLIKGAKKFAEKKCPQKAMELLKKAVENADEPEAFTEYAKLLSVYGWPFAGSLLARGYLAFPEDKNVCMHLLFIVMMLKDLDTFRMYTDFGRSLNFELSEIEKLLPEYEEALGLDAEEADDDSDGEEAKPIQPAYVLDREASERKFRLVDDFEEWLESQDDDVIELSKGRGIPQIETIAKYVDKKIELKSPFSEKEKNILGEALFSKVMLEGGVSEEADALAYRMLKADRDWKKPLMVKGKFSQFASPEDKAFAKELTAELDKFGGSLDTEEFTLYYAMRQGLYKEVCDYCEKNFDLSDILTEELEYCYAYSSVMLDRIDSAERSFTKLTYLDPFSLTYFSCLVFARLIKENGKKWNYLKAYFPSTFIAPKKAPKKVFEAVAAEISEKDRVRLAAAMIDREDRVLPEIASEIRRCRLIASDIWISKITDLKKELENVDCGRIGYADEHIAYNLVFDRVPKLRKTFVDYICFSIRTCIPLTKDALDAAAGILDDMYNTLSERNLLPKRYTFRWNEMAMLTLLWRLGLQEAEISGILKSSGISEKTYRRFRDSIYN